MIAARERRVVLDTNVLLDVWLFDDPATRPLRDALLTGRLRAVRSAECDAEFADVVARPQFGLDVAARQRVLDDWARSSRPIALTAPAPLACADLDDQKFLDAAFSAGAEALFTRDRQLLQLARSAARHGLAICSPSGAAFAAVLRTAA